MIPEIEALARHRLLRARETFNEGECLLSHGSFAGAVNRFYYSAFYAARALIALLLTDSAKHSGIISLFQRHFVKTGIINPELARALPRSFEKRQKTDYADFTVITIQEAETVRNDVAKFINACADTLQKVISGDIVL